MGLWERDGMKLVVQEGAAAAPLHFCLSVTRVTVNHDSARHKTAKMFFKERGKCCEDGEKKPRNMR